MQHDHNCPKFTAIANPVRVKKNSRLSELTIILSGVTIEEGYVIAAGAVVPKSTEPYLLYRGVPAKVIGLRKRQIEYKFGSGGATPFI